MVTRKYNTTEKRIWDKAWFLVGMLIVGILLVSFGNFMSGYVDRLESRIRPSDFPDLSHEVRLVTFSMLEPEIKDIAYENLHEKYLSLLESTNRPPTKAEIVGLIAKKSYEAGIDPVKMLRITRCESKFDHLAINKDSSSRGLFQIIKSTQKEVEAKTGKKYDVFDPVENIEMAVWLNKKYGDKPWNASKECWNI